MRDLIDVLIAWDGDPSDGTGTYIMREGRYLSGHPYLWSQFGERAYLLPSAERARQLIAHYPRELAGATIHQRHP